MEVLRKDKRNKTFPVIQTNVILLAFVYDNFVEK